MLDKMGFVYREGGENDTRVLYKVQTSVIVGLVMVFHVKAVISILHSQGVSNTVVSFLSYSFLSLVFFSVSSTEVAARRRVVVHVAVVVVHEVPRLEGGGTY